MTQHQGDRTPRTAAEIAARMASETAVEPPIQRAQGASVWGFIVLLVKISLAVAGLGALAFAGLIYVTLQNQPKPPSSVAAAVAWDAVDVTVSPESPTLHGRLSLSGPSIPASGLDVGVSIGVPSIPDLSPATALLGPAIRLTARSTSGSTSTCFAPCELDVPSSFDCGGGMCRMDVEVTVDLVGKDIGSTGVVAVTVSGGVTGGSGTTIAKPFPVELAFDVPSGSAGS
jgi:hypothetical protein